MTGCSRARVSRLIKTYTTTGSLKRQQRTTNGFTHKYTRLDKRLQRLISSTMISNGCAIKKILVCAVETISETFLIPALEELPASFPFKLPGFHSGNGLEYVNHRVGKLPYNLPIKFTKSRSRKTNNNALVESKNGSVIRKIPGYAHIPRHHEKQINEFNRHYLTPHLNYHRPCFGNQEI